MENITEHLFINYNGIRFSIRIKLLNFEKYSSFFKYRKSFTFMIRIKIESDQKRGAAKESHKEKRSFSVLLSQL